LERYLKLCTGQVLPLRLIGGLGTEAILFCLFAHVDIPHEEYDWSLAYPELGGMGGHEEDMLDKIDILVYQYLAQLDAMLADAKIGPELIESLGSGMRAIK
jgi:hypothetical protein